MNRTIKLLVIALITIPLLLSCDGTGKKEQLKINYEQYTLDNGLKIVLHEDHSDPIVSLAIQFHVGSGREKPGKTGFAHFFEHMLFQRSENLPRNAFFEKISAMGGDFNGGTGQDGTIYYETVPRDALEKVLWMEADRMGYFINTVTQQGLEREIDIILNEKRQTTDNQPYGQQRIIYAEEFFPEGHPYSWSVIGMMDDIRSATIEDVKEFYGTYYIPQNATLVLAGDFDPAKAKELINKYFGEIPKGKDIEKPKVWIPELAQTKKLMYEDQFAPLPYFSLYYPVVEQYNEDEAPLDVLAELLSGSKKSPLYKTIVETNMAPNVIAYNMSQEVAGTFVISARTYAGKSLDSVYAAINEAFEIFERDGVDAQELEMIKAMQESNVYNSLSSVNGKAMSLARNKEYGGKPDRFIDELAKYKAVTAEDVMRVYNKYIKGRNFLALSMVPKGESALALTGSIPAIVNVEKVDDASGKQTKSKAGAIIDDDYPRTPSSFDRSVEPAYLSNSPDVTLPKIWSKELANGMKMSGVTHNEIPLVTFDIAMKGGLLLDPTDKPGVAYLNAALMNEGTSLRSAEEIEQALNLLGASARVYSRSNSMGVSGVCLSRNFEKVMEIVEEMILNPSFDEKVLEREKKKVMARIQQEAKSPSAIASKAMSKLQFGEQSILTMSEYGTKESLASITIEDIKKFYTEKFSPSLASVNMAGAIDIIAAEKALTSLVADWKGGNVDVPTPAVGQSDSYGKLYFIDYPGATQSYIMVGGNGLPYSNPNYYALDVLNFKLGSGSNGELFNVLRLQRGYTYGAYSYFSPKNNYGRFTASSSVQGTVTKESVEIFENILGTWGKNYNEEILASSKDALLRQKAFSFETQRGLLSMLNSIYLNDLPTDYVKREELVIKNATLEQMKGFATEYLNKDGLIYVVVGDAKSQMNKLPNAIKY